MLPQALYCKHGQARGSRHKQAKRHALFDVGLTISYHAL